MKTSTWTQLAFCLLSSVFYACNSSHVYYLDATSGSDQNNGTSPRSAWQSIEALKQISLQPGDKILFKKGETFPGILEVTGKGTYTHPIIIDAYGEGNQNHVLQGMIPPCMPYVFSTPITSQFKTLKSVIQVKNERPDVLD
ncbi:hypothetical protein [Phocaeicola plebeius]|uniref:hypothetical protein n=1 Tax=Phocaeicola plebeius TaxID=310297 RepID=UPI0026EE8F42|nr:hypothetical protein [Phocaeicola plebeius]